MSDREAGEWRPGFRTAWQPTGGFERSFEEVTGKHVALALLTVSEGLRNGMPEARPYVWNRGEKRRQKEVEMRLEAVRCWAGWRLIRDGEL